MATTSDSFHQWLHDASIREHTLPAAQRAVLEAGFQEFTIVLKGLLRVKHKDGVLDVHAGQAVISHPGEWVQDSTPEPEGTESIAVFNPAFALETVYRYS